MVLLETWSYRFSNKFVNLEIEGETKFMLKNYLFLMLKTIVNPYEINDYYEARTRLLVDLNK